MAGHPGYWRDLDGSAVAAHEAEAAWAEAALAVLRTVAAGFGDQIDYTELSARVQENSGIRTRVPVFTWIGGVLRRVMQATRDNGEPPLSVLVIPKRGDGSAEAAWSTARMQCYRRYCADLAQEEPWLNAHTSAQGSPRGGATRGQTDKTSKTGKTTASTTSRKQPTRATGPRSGRSTRPSRDASTRPASRSTPAPPALCPQCFLALPATGTCDNCS